MQISYTNDVGDTLLTKDHDVLRTPVIYLMVNPINTLDRWAPLKHIAKRSSGLS